jgi:hypothetical protein
MVIGCYVYVWCEFTYYDYVIHSSVIGSQEICLFCGVQIGSVVHPVFYPAGTGGSFVKGTAASVKLSTFLGGGDLSPR